MSALFVRLDVTWVDNPKLIAAGMDGRGCHATALCLAKRLETDGWVDRALLAREGATDDLVDRLADLELFEVDGRRVRPAGWHDRNPSQGAIDATRTAKAEAARAGNHKRWNHPGSVADCAVCAPPVQVDRTCDPVGSHSVATPSPDTESETDTYSPLTSQGSSGSGPVDSVNHAPEADGSLLEGDALVQAVRRTAALVGRSVAAGQAGVVNVAGYAAKVTEVILTGDDPLPRQRIKQELLGGSEPEAIAAGWQLDPFGLGSARPAPVAAHAPLQPAPLDEIRAQAEEAARDPLGILRRLRERCPACDGPDINDPMAHGPNCAFVGFVEPRDGRETVA